MNMDFRIKRTRTIEEVFSVSADTEEDAYALLADSDTVMCQDGVEQTTLSTIKSEVELLVDTSW
jgi:hypothetical protein